MAHRKWTVTTAAAVLVVGLCASLVSTSVAVAASKPSGTPILIGQIATETGAAGQTGRITTARDGLEAWVKWTNAHGGINGHPVESKTIDDKADPAQSASALRELVEQDHVLAIVGQATGIEATWKDYIAGAGVPVIGGPAYSANWFTQPMFYPATTTVVSNIYGFIDAGATKGKKKLASILCSTSTICQDARPITVDAAKRLGMTVVYDGSADPSAASYTPQCLAMKDAGADVISPQGIPKVNLLRDCQRSEEHTSELQSLRHLVCRLLL